MNYKFWKEKDATGVDVSISVAIPEDRLPNREECEVAIELLSHAIASFSAIKEKEDTNNAFEYE